MSVSRQVYVMETQFKKLQKIHAETVQFLRTIGKKDPRSGGFIAECVLRHLGEPSNYLLEELKSPKKYISIWEWQKDHCHCVGCCICELPEYLRKLGQDV